MPAAPRLPNGVPPRLVQPDARSCGAAAMVVARLLVDPGYAPFVRSQADFARETLAQHRRLTGAARPAGGLQLPWPRVIGTPPWAVRSQLAALTGRPYRIVLARTGPGAAHDTLAAAVTPDAPAALYVGSRWLPRHVTLVLAADAETLHAYEPSSGEMRTASRAELVDGRLRLGWHEPWFAVVAR